MFAFITPNVHYAGITQADVIIEAIVKNLQVKVTMLG
ncbi:hypothetical protein [Candidatus Enterovibrio altilux]|nr:hypothetical protein [Candidatus Enterovibrio luxaltus]